MTATAMSAAQTDTALPILGREHTAAVFRALLDATARPGVLGRIPQPENTAVAPALIPALALADLMVSVAAVDASGAADAALASELSRATGAPVVDPAAARILVAGADAPLSAAAAAELIASATRGEPLAPQRAALIVIGVAGLEAAEDSAADADVRVLTGPGVDGEARVRIAGLDDGVFAARARACADFPCGVDILLVAEDGTVCGLPRTTRVASAEQASAEAGSTADAAAPTASIEKEAR